jgi:hypothetical protein
MRLILSRDVEAKRIEVKADTRHGVDADGKPVHSEAFSARALDSRSTNCAVARKITRARRSIAHERAPAHALKNNTRDHTGYHVLTKELPTSEVFLQAAWLG